MNLIPMRKIAIFLILAMVLIVGYASAYELIISCPATLPVGAPLTVTGTTTYPAGTTFDMVFSFTGQTSNQVASVPVTISGEKTEAGDRTFSVVFETTGLAGGQYKVEAQLRGDAVGSLSSGSVTLKIIDLVDRSDEIHITSSLNQRIPNALLLEGYIDKIGSSGVQIDVTGPQGNVFGPTYIGTTTRGGNNEGYFSQRIAVDQVGNYYVLFSDGKGYIGQKMFTVNEPLPTLTAPVTEVPTIAATTSGTQVPPVTTAAPSTTKATAPLTGIIGGLCIAGILLSGKIRK
jgi:autotransporter adhesin